MQNENFESAVSFIRSIGIDIRFSPLNDDTFLPGLSIQQGVIIVDKSKLLYPGDILHEAGHIAVVPLSERHTLNADTIGKREQHPAEEMMAIAWSYAACIALEIHPYFVFHDDGYKQGGQSIADSFAAGHYFGVPVLAWLGMTRDPFQSSVDKTRAYPYMLNWIRH
ncbi:MAG: hypothetical protein ABW007_01795 [Chitinophagaceae bacterium]